MPVAANRGKARDPLTWGWLEDGTQRVVRLTCPNGHYALLDDHEIAGDGSVTPSVLCPWHCGFHDTVRLMGWES